MPVTKWLPFKIATYVCIFLSAVQLGLFLYTNFRERIKNDSEAAAMVVVISLFCCQTIFHVQNARWLYRHLPSKTVPSNASKGWQVVLVLVASITVLLYAWGIIELSMEYLRFSKSRNRVYQYVAFSLLVAVFMINLYTIISALLFRKYLETESKNHDTQWIEQLGQAAS